LSANQNVLTDSITKPTKRFQFVVSGRNSSNSNNNSIKRKKTNKNVLKQQRKQKKKRSWLFSVILSSSRRNQKSNYTGDNFLLEQNNLSENKSSSRQNFRPISWGALQTKKYFESSHGAQRFLVEENQSLHHQCFHHRQNCQRYVYNNFT